MSIQVGIQPGSAMIVGSGSNAGGPVIINGTIVNATTGYGVAK
jgi:hypothetical protein